MVQGSMRCGRKAPYIRRDRGERNVSLLTMGVLVTLFTVILTDAFLALLAFSAIAIFLTYAGPFAPGTLALSTLALSVLRTLGAEL